MPEPEPVCACGHGRLQHSRYGCTTCECGVLYMELSPQNPNRPIKKGKL